MKKKHPPLNKRKRARKARKCWNSLGLDPCRIAQGDHKIVAILYLLFTTVIHAQVLALSLFTSRARQWKNERRRQSGERARFDTNAEAKGGEEKKERGGKGTRRRMEKEGGRRRWVRSAETTCRVRGPGIPVAPRDHRVDAFFPPPLSLSPFVHLSSFFPSFRYPFHRTAPLSPRHTSRREHYRIMRISTADIRTRVVFWFRWEWFFFFKFLFFVYLKSEEIWSEKN